MPTTAEVNTIQAQMGAIEVYVKALDAALAKARDDMRGLLSRTTNVGSGSGGVRVAVEGRAGAAAAFTAATTEVAAIKTAVDAVKTAIAAVTYSVGTP